MSEESILIEAEKTVNGDRRKVYGHPIDDYERVAKMWTGVLGDLLKPGVEIPPERATLCMAALKISRLVKSPNHRDSAVDLAGYAWVHRAVVEEQAARIERDEKRAADAVAVMQMIQNEKVGTDGKEDA